MSITDVSMIVSTTSPQRPFPLKKRLASADVSTNSLKPAREQDSALQSTTKRWLKAVGLVLVGGRLGNTAEGLGGKKAHITLYRHFQANLSTGWLFCPLEIPRLPGKLEFGGGAYQYGVVRGRWCRAKHRVTATGFAPVKVERVD